VVNKVASTASSVSIVSTHEAGGWAASASNDQALVGGAIHKRGSFVIRRKAIVREEG
jgi:hypothetical protein